jgi:Cu/Ag efflux pump CusA
MSSFSAKTAVTCEKPLRESERVFSLTKLPIDAVPDITNNQVQINTVAPSYSPVDIW